jgi:hypothetical protein
MQALLCAAGRASTEDASITAVVHETAGFSFGVLEAGGVDGQPSGRQRRQQPKCHGCDAASQNNRQRGIVKLRGIVAHRVIAAAQNEAGSGVWLTIARMRKLRMQRACLPERSSRDDAILPFTATKPRHSSFDWILSIVTSTRAAARLF